MVYLYLSNIQGVITMNFIVCTYLFLLLNIMLLHAEPQYPVDISYLIADCKYSKQDGLKICELQHGALSALGGDLCLSGDDGIIAPILADFFDQFPLNKWTTRSIYSPLQRSLAKKNWNIEQSLQTILHNQLFLAYADQAPGNKYSIDSYQGIVYADSEIVKNSDLYRNQYPGIIFLNAAILPYWNDKYSMSKLFDKDEELKQYKADWRLYPKQYSPDLAAQIQKDMPSELYVIKPRKETLANGVIVVSKHDLDTTLQSILQPHTQKNLTREYAYWKTNQDNNFIIEKYYASDYITTPAHFNTRYNESNQYDATMRIVFVLEYNNGIMKYHPLGGFWKLPSKSLQEEGTLNQTRVSCCKPPFYDRIDAHIYQEVNEQMEKAMLLLYDIMLHDHDGI